MKSNNKTRCGVIGTGNMGRNHVRVYSELEDVNFVAVAELDERLGSETAKQFNTKYYKHYQEMLDKENLDIVSICVPTSFHYDVAKICLQHKVHTLLEKPIATTLQEGKELLTLAKKSKVNLLVGHIERHNPAVKKIKEMIVDGKLGDIISLIARRVGGFPYQIRDATVLVDLAIHDIDIINYLLDDLPKEVQINKQRTHIQQREDAVEYFLKYKKASAYIQCNWITPVKIRKLNITGSEGYAEIDYINQTIDFYKSNYEKFKQEYHGFSDFILRFGQPSKINIDVEKKEPLKEEIKYMVESVQKGRKIDSQFAVDALKTALL